MQIASAPGGKREAFTTEPYLWYGDRGNEDASREMRRRMHRSWQTYFVTAPKDTESSIATGAKMKSQSSLLLQFIMNIRQAGSCQARRAPNSCP